MNNEQDKINKEFANRISNVERLYNPVIRDPGHQHTYPMGDIYYFSVTGTAITISAQSNGSTNMVVVNPATTLTSFPMGFDMPSNGRLRYKGSTTRYFHIACSISFSGGNSDTFVIGVAKNGTVIAGSKVLRKMGAGGDVGSTAIYTYTRMNPNDYLEIYVGNTTDTDDPTFHTINLFAMGMDN